jgi:hypothetical protein
MEDELIRGSTWQSTYDIWKAGNILAGKAGSHRLAGFRLAVANDTEKYAGSGYIFPPTTAGSMKVGHNGPSEKYKNLGFRLVHEEET